MFGASFILAALLAYRAVAVPSPTEMTKRATCTVDSVSSANDVSDCSTVVIKGFTVPSGGEYDARFVFVV